MPPTVPIHHVIGPTAHRCYSMLIHPSPARLEHSSLLKVTPGGGMCFHTHRTPAHLDYERFNYSNVNICSWSWNYRGCWHQTCPPVVTRRFLYLLLIPIAHTLRHCIGISCHYLPVSGLGNLRACCLPWMWWPSLRPPLRNQTLIPRYPLSPW